MIRVNVKGIAYDINGTPIVLLTDLKEEKILPIWIGLLEAQSIAIALENVAAPRPLTHDLMKNIFDLLGAKIKHIIITDIFQNTYYAEIHLESPKEVCIDSRPSDAIALALRTGAPVFVSEKIHEQMLNINEVIDEETRAELEKFFNSKEFKDYKRSLH